MNQSNVQIGRVIRVGRRWADVVIDQKVRRIWTRPDLLVRAGCYVQIIRDQGVALLPSNEQHTTKQLH